jgi:phage-related protein
VAQTSPPDVVFEGDSRKMIRSFPPDVRENLGADLWRLQKGEKPLDAGSLTNVLRKVFYLRDDDKDFWYRVPYITLAGVVYVLDCFKKKTNEIAQKDINTARSRLTVLKKRFATKKH